MPNFFEELNASIKIMNEQSNDRLTASADYIYSGDVKKWIRFANSLKLRLAMRIVNADPTTARKDGGRSIGSSIRRCY